ncbi:MAG TPA: tripartite tricarboxylate transporter substrate binding protein [Burkholderiales bacterium]|jgi:tripartite-type tricarboxylate transporter receptor subunit TctC|nr:tripartite tricarboxylate transporter substrate binding protein [Burkholderiales bacterium]
MIARLLAAACVLALAVPAHAQEFPSRPVKIVAPFAAGGSADLIPRIVGERLSAMWGQPVIVENRPGAGGNIAAEYVYRAEPDGYTLLSSPPSTLIINQYLYANLAYDQSHWVPVSVMVAVPNVLLVNPKVAAKSVQELIAYARANPDKLNYASQGSGTTSHLTGEMFKTVAGVHIAHIPYKGSAPALTDLLAGQVEMMFDNLGVSLQHVKSGRLRALAVGSERRVASLPDVPAMSEVLPGFESVTWFGVVAPPKAPMPIAEKISAAIAEALRSPDARKRLADLSAEPIGNTPAQMAAFMRKDAERWREVIRSAGVKAD